MIIIGMDPGVQNFAFALVDTGLKHITSGYLTSIKSIEDISKLSENSWLWELSPDHVIIERFLTRHQVKGNLSEFISIQIGWMVREMEILGIEWDLILASQWKLWMKRHQIQWEHWLPTIHESDALAMAVWWLLNNTHLTLEDILEWRPHTDSK